MEEKKSFLDDFKCIFHENHTDFEKKVEALQKDESQQNVRIGFIVRAKQQCCGEDSTHLTPIYVEKKDGITNCVIIDSIGKNQTYESNCSIRLNSLGIVPYVYTGRRQTDSTSCFVYALRDMVEISKNRFFLDSVITSAAKYNEKAPRTELDFSKHFFNDLPPNMMKGAQSLTMLYEYNQNYEEENQTQHPVVTTTKDREGKSLQDFIKRNVEEDKNLYAFRRSRKYARLLILEAIKMSSE